jgi:hypothetical protein
MNNPDITSEEYEKEYRKLFPQRVTTDVAGRMIGLTLDKE